MKSSLTVLCAAAVLTAAIVVITSARQGFSAKNLPVTELTGVQSLGLLKFAGREGWFAPACVGMEVGGCKPPFPTCEFEQPERFTASPRLPVTPSRSLLASSRRRMLSGEHFRLSYPAHLKQREVEYVLMLLEANRADLSRRVSIGGILFQLPTLELFINESTGDFVGRTGQPPWVAATTLRNRIELQPLELLSRRRILETTIRHELVHSVIEIVGHGRAPRWLTEGLALHIAGEGPKVVRYSRKSDITLVDLELRLSRHASAEDMKADYAAAYREVKKLIDAEGESAVWRRVAALRSS